MRVLLAVAVTALPYSVLAAGTTTLGPCPPGFVEVRSGPGATGIVTESTNGGGTAACAPAPPLRPAEAAPRPAPFPTRDFRDPMPANASELRLVSYNPPSPTALAQQTSTRVLTRTYDDFDRVATETVPLEDGGTATIRYTYWRNGVRKTMTDAFGRVTFYEYDGKNRLSRVTANQGLPDEHVTSYTYWPDDLLKTIAAPNGTVTSYDYDRADRVKSIVLTRDSVLLLSYAYTYDANGNRLTQTETNGGAPELTTYTYDARDRLETVTYPSGASVTYGYDPVGNRTSEIERDPSGTIVSNKTAVFDAINRLSSVTDSVDASQSATFTYDANGNLLTKTTAAGTETYDYDPRDLMVEARSGTAILARYAYDAFGRRYLKVASEGPFASVVRQYLYDQTSLLHELDDSDLEVAKYEYGGDRLASLVRRDEPRRFYHQDALGSVVALSDSAGAVVARYHLDAWGRYRAPSELDASANRFGFTGYLFDQETELYYAKARFYDPEYGRFTSQDSVLGEINEPPSLHRYFYGHANPLRYVDPTGHSAVEGFTSLGSLAWEETAAAHNVAVNWFGGLVYNAGQKTGLGGESFKGQAEAFTAVADPIDDSARRSLQSPAHLLTAVVESEIERKQRYDAAIDRGDLKGAQREAVGFLSQVAGARGVATSLTTGAPGLAVTPQGALVGVTGSVAVSPGGVGAGVLMMGSNKPTTIEEDRGTSGGSSDGLAQSAGSPNRGVIWVRETPTSKKTDVVRYQAEASGARTEIATRTPEVPALRFDNPNPRGRDLVKFDGLEGEVLIDRKWSLTSRSKQKRDLLRMAEAVRQNPGYKARIEVPVAAQANRANRLLDKLGIQNIDVKLVPASE